MSELGKKIINKIEKKKTEKETKLLNSAYKLFTEKGIHNTSIQDIVDNAGVAKGTFYLYFQDKYKIQEALIIKKSSELFKQAIEDMNNSPCEKFDDQVIMVIDTILNTLKNEPTLVNFISKDLSLALYNDRLNKIISNNEINIYNAFINKAKEHNIHFKNADVTLFTILELVSSTCFMTIAKNKPLPIDEYKPYLYDIIRKIINE